MISYSKSFMSFATRMRITGPSSTVLAYQTPSTVADVIDPNLRHVMVTAGDEDNPAGDYWLEMTDNKNNSVNAAVIIDSSHGAGNGALQIDAAASVSREIDQNLNFANQTYVHYFDHTYDDIQQFWVCVNLAAGESWSCRYANACQMVRMPHDPNNVKIEHRRLGLRSESPGQQFHQEGLGTYRVYTMEWERLAADQLKALDEAYHTVPTLEAPVLLHDDTDPQGAAFGRFIGFDWDSESFELLYHATMVFEEIVIPS